MILLGADDDNILEIPDRVKADLTKWANKEKKKFTNPEIRKLVTWKSLAQQILANATERQRIKGNI